MHGEFGEDYEKTDKNDEHDCVYDKTLGQDKLKQVKLMSRDGEDSKKKFIGAHAFMIVVASDDGESFQSIDKWKDLIRSDNQLAPINLVFIQKTLEESSESIVSEAMILKKCQGSDFEGATTVSNKDMSNDEFTTAMDQAI